MPPPIPAPREAGTTTTTEVPLYWVRYGVEGAPPLLVVHGGPGAHHDYLLPRMLALGGLDGGRDLLFYDQRGGGRSKTDALEVITWKTQVNDLAKVIAEFRLGAPTIVGYSWGALLTLLYAAEAARDTSLPSPKALVLVDPAPISRKFRDVFEREFARRQNGPAVARQREELNASGLRARDPEAHRQRNFELSVAGYFADPASARDLTPFRVMARVQQSVWESMGEFDLAADGRLASIRAPSLITHGRQDPIPLASSEECARVMKARLVVIDQCGHVPYVEQPVALFSAVESFLRERRAAG
ncbi:MAG TPA: alpha/beta hydrolase [Gemmatimonadaceae bacterium]